MSFRFHAPKQEQYSLSETNDAFIVTIKACLYNSDYEALAKADSVSGFSFKMDEAARQLVISVFVDQFNSRSDAAFRSSLAKVNVNNGLTSFDNSVIIQRYERFLATNKLVSMNSAKISKDQLDSSGRGQGYAF